MTLALEGVKVLDFSRQLPGPFCSMILADFGADVLRVEEPGAGTRPSGRRAAQAGGAEQWKGLDKIVAGRPYDGVSRNKKSIILNLKHPAAQEVARQLAAQSDVVLTEFRPGVAQRLGVGYETLRKVNPRLIYCEITLYGQNGPYIQYPGHDPCALAVAGLLELNGDEGGPPRFAAAPIDDISTSLHAAIGILLALRARDRTGQGQYVDISMLDAALDFNAMTSQVLFRGSRVPRLNRPSPSGGVFQCQDGKWLCTTNLETHHWANFCRAIGREDMIPLQWDRQRRQELYEQVKEILLTRTREEWLKAFWDPELESQAAPIHSMEEVFDDPQVRARQMVVELDHPQAGKVKQMGISIKLSQTPGQIRSFAPLPGEHTQQVLSSLGYSPSQIKTLANEGAIS